MANWQGTVQPPWPGRDNARAESNVWGHRRDNDEAGVVRRGVVFESATAVTTIRYGNGDRWYLVSATTGSSTTVTFGSATKNTGAENTIRNLAAGNVIAATAGGTFDGSVTQSTSAATTIWKSDGAVWRRMFSSEAGGLPAPSFTSQSGTHIITLGNGDTVYIVSQTSTVAAVTVNIPFPSPTVGKCVDVKITNNTPFINVVVSTPSGQIGDYGAASVTLSGGLTAWMFIADGTDYWLRNKF